MQTPTTACQEGYHQQVSKHQALARTQREGSLSALLVGRRAGAATTYSGGETPPNREDGTITWPGSPASGC